MSGKKLLVFFLFLCSATTFAKSKVTTVFAKSDLCKTKMCLHGSFKKGTPVVLLSKSKEETCTAMVGASFSAAYSSGPFEASELARIKSCKLNPEDIFLAVFDKPKLKYKIIPMTKLEGADLSSQDKALKKSRAFSKAWKKEVFRKDGNKDRAPYELADYKLLEPVGFTAKVSSKTDIPILRHKFSMEGGASTMNDGILFSLYKNEWSPVSSAFSKGKPFMFSVNGRLMVHSVVTCQLNCGYQDNEIYEFNGRVFKMIYNNADFSN